MILAVIILCPIVTAGNLLGKESREMGARARWQDQASCKQQQGFMGDKKKVEASDPD